MRIYLDYAASTPVCPEVFEAMRPFFFEKYGNASSVHSFGREAEIALDHARETIARFFGVTFKEVYFTSGATEANNWIAHTTYNQEFITKNIRPHVITSTIEHESMLESIKQLEKEKIIDVTYILPDKDGIINPQGVQKALKKETLLVSIMYVNNEIGSIQLIKEIGRIIKKFRQEKQTSYPIFHSDAVQAIQFLEPRLEYLNLDAMTVSSHKIYGPKGMGALIVKDQILKPLLYGGGQEFQKRAGTENIPSIVGFGKAIELISNNDYRIGEESRVRGLKKYFISGILKKIEDAIIVGDEEKNAPHIVSIIFPKVESQIFLIALDQEGIAASSGSACSIKAIKPSYVLTSLGYSANFALSALRFSLGRSTTLEDVKKTLTIMGKTHKKFVNH